MKQPAQHAPPTSWIIALAMALALLASFVYFISTPGIVGDLPLLKKFHAEIDEHLTVPPSERDRPRGVMLASSGGMCAAEGPLKLSEAGPDLMILSFPIGTFDDFYPVAEKLVDRKPDFVIIQSSVLIDKSPLEHEYRLFVGAVNHLVRDKVLGNAPETYPDIHPRHICTDNRAPEEAWRYYKSQIDNKRSNQLSRASRARIVDAFHSLNRAHIPIMIVDVPRYPDTEEYGHWVMARVRDLVANAQHPMHRVTYHAMSEVLPTERFIDPYHVMTSVRPLYRAWLYAEIHKALNPP